MDLDSVDYLLFDYKSDNYGGSGKSFDWIIVFYTGLLDCVFSTGLFVFFYWIMFVFPMIY